MVFSLPLLRRRRRWVSVACGPYRVRLKDGKERFCGGLREICQIFALTSVDSIFDRREKAFLDLQTIWKSRRRKFLNRKLNNQTTNDMAKKSEKTATSKSTLEPLHVKLSEKPVKNGDVVTVLVDDDYPTRYNTASSIAKQAGKLMDEMKPAMIPDALARIMQVNGVHPWEPVASVAYQDPNGNVTRVSFTNKYKEVPAQVAEALFKNLQCKPQEETEGKQANINDYMQRTVVGAFNSECFLNAEGKFDKARYDRIMGALDKVAGELGIQNPVATQEVVKPLPTFPARRWVDFDVDTNLKISKVLINQLQFVPCANVVTGKIAGEEETDEKAEAK
jgi:hypothetical protein